MFLFKQNTLNGNCAIQPVLKFISKPEPWSLCDEHKSLPPAISSSQQAAAVTQSPTVPPTGRCQTSVRMTCRHGGHPLASRELPCPSTSTCPTRATRVDMCPHHSARRRAIKRKEDARVGVLPHPLWGETDHSGEPNC